MQSKGYTAGALAGLVAGLVFGVMMQMMSVPTADGGTTSMLAMVASIVRSDSVVVGWLYHLFNSAVIGGLFGSLLGDRVRGYRGGLGWGTAWGVFWWVLGGLILMPVLLGMPAFSPLTMPEIRTVAFGSLMGHVAYGLVLGGTYVRLHAPRVNYPTPHARPARPV